MDERLGGSRLKNIMQFRADWQGVIQSSKQTGGRRDGGEGLPLTATVSASVPLVAYTVTAKVAVWVASLHRTGKQPCANELEQEENERHKGKPALGQTNQQHRVAWQHEDGTHNLRCPLPLLLEMMVMFVAG